MDLETTGVGGVIITSNYDELKKWVISSIEKYDIELHGDKYIQKFISLKINDIFSICFYIISGYDTHSENIAFAHTEFVIDGFLEILSENNPSEEYLAFVDVGTTIGKDEFIGFKSVEEGFNHFKTDLISIVKLRDNNLEEGEVIWEI